MNANCERGHLDSCKPKKHDDIPNFWCIDVNTRTRSSIESNDDYYGLSYVWREGQNEDDSADQEIADDKNNMIVVSGLLHSVTSGCNFRYGHTTQYGA